MMQRARWHKVVSSWKSLENPFQSQPDFAIIDQSLRKAAARRAVLRAVCLLEVGMIRRVTYQSLPIIVHGLPLALHHRAVCEGRGGRTYSKFAPPIPQFRPYHGEPGQSVNPENGLPRNEDTGRMLAATSGHHRRLLWGSGFRFASMAKSRSNRLGNNPRIFAPSPKSACKPQAYRLFRLVSIISKLTS
jgi:hypothetical protein